VVTRLEIHGKILFRSPHHRCKDIIKTKLTQIGRIWTGFANFLTTILLLVSQKGPCYMDLVSSLQLHRAEDQEMITMN
jgi:hypothetical protein